MLPVVLPMDLGDVFLETTPECQQAPRDSQTSEPRQVVSEFQGHNPVCPGNSHFQSAQHGAPEAPAVPDQGD